MAVFRYVSHGDVVKDPTVPVPRWSLNERGRAQASALAAAPWVESVTRLVSSAETKAIEMARPLADGLGLDLEIRAETGETDRSATGYVPPERHDALAAHFFAEPERSADGWERAIDAQERVRAALADLLVADGPGDVVVVGHGGVGTLLWCSLTGRPIDAAEDQDGPGNVWAWDLAGGVPLHPWQAIDTP
ncbi:MAG: histidine phosphatase family protein [Actinomycetota bacterium]